MNKIANPINAIKIKRKRHCNVTSVSGTKWKSRGLSPITGLKDACGNQRNPVVELEITPYKATNALCILDHRNYKYIRTQHAEPATSAKRFLLKADENSSSVLLLYDLLLSVKLLASLHLLVEYCRNLVVRYSFTTTTTTTTTTTMKFQSTVVGAALVLASLESSLAFSSSKMNQQLQQQKQRLTNLQMVATVPEIFNEVDGDGEDQARRRKTREVS